jgi:hypothetical protein
MYSANKTAVSNLPSLLKRSCSCVNRLFAPTIGITEGVIHPKRDCRSEGKARLAARLPPTLVSSLAFNLSPRQVAPMH